MSIILRIPVRENTSKEPLRYFDEIISKDFINLAKEAFFSEFFNDIESQSRFPAEKDYKKDTITISFQEEIDWDEYQGPSFAWKTNVYKFSEALQKNLRIKANETFLYLNKKAESDNEEKSKKECFKNIVCKITKRFESVSKEERFYFYRDVLIESLSHILGFIYFKHPNFAPRKTNLINEILQISEKGNLSYEPMTLNKEFLHKLIAFKLLEDSRPLVQIENEFQAKKDLNFLFYKSVEKISSPIKIITGKKKVSAVYYILSRLAFYLEYDEKDFEKNKFFTINNKPYSANSSYTAKFRLTNHKYSDKSQIDEFIEGLIS